MRMPRVLSNGRREAKPPVRLAFARIRDLRDEGRRGCHPRAFGALLLGRDCARRPRQARVTTAISRASP